MITNKTQMAAQTPSGFALPISAAAFGTGAGMAGLGNAAVCAVPATPTYVVRDRHVAGTALTQATRPGSTAWSPPTC
jgi:hypothetical protein